MAHEMQQDAHFGEAAELDPPAQPVGQVRMPGFEQLFQLCTNARGLPYQLGRGSFGAVFLCELRPEARLTIPTLCPGLIVPAIRDILLQADVKFACKYVIVPDTEADGIFKKEVVAAMQLNDHVMGGPWEPLMRATLTSTLLGWRDDLYEAAENPATRTHARATMPWVEKGSKVVHMKEARLIRTVMELNYTSLPGSRHEELKLFCNLQPTGEPEEEQLREVALYDETTRIFTKRQIPDVRKADKELAGTG